MGQTNALPLKGIRIVFSCKGCNISTNQGGQGDCIMLGIMGQWGSCKLAGWPGSSRCCREAVLEDPGWVIEPRCRLIMDYLSIIPDPRSRKFKHQLNNILLIALVASLCGAEDFVSIAEFGKIRKGWFAKFLDLSNGIPSHDRFNALYYHLRLFGTL